MLTTLSQLLAAVPFLTLLIAVVGTWLLRRRPGRMRPAWLGGFVLFLLAAEGPAPPDATPGHPPHHTVEFGADFGSYSTCSGARRFGDGGAMYRYTTSISAQTDAMVAGGAYAGMDGDAPQVAVRVAAGLDHRWLGGSLGLVGGVLRRESTLSSPVMPTASLRLGPRDILFLDASYLDQSPAPLPQPLIEVGAGVAFPRLGNGWEPLRVRAGVSFSGFYVSPTLPLGDFGNLDLVAAFGDANTWEVSSRVRLHFAAAP